MIVWCPFALCCSIFDLWCIFCFALGAAVCFWHAFRRWCPFGVGGFASFMMWRLQDQLSSTGFSPVWPLLISELCWGSFIIPVQLVASVECSAWNCICYVRVILLVYLGCELWFMLYVDAVNFFLFCFVKLLYYFEFMNLASRKTICMHCMSLILINKTILQWFLLNEFN